MSRVAGEKDTLSGDATDFWFTDAYFPDGNGEQPAAAAAPRPVASAVPQPTLVPSDTLYSSQWHLSGTWGINVQGVWDEFTGDGVRVAVYDEGIDWNHVDLAARVDQSLSFDAVRLTTGGYPIEADDSHGTAVAGVVAASRNGVGAVGVAFDANLVSIYQGFSPANSGNDVAAFGHASSLADVMNNSWGYGAGGVFYDNFRSIFDEEGAALTSAAQLGRGGLGTNIVFAAGNDRTSGDNTNYHNFINDRHVIGVAASDSSGAIASFSTPGASILVTAPGVGITTTDRAGSAGYASGDYYNQFAGTSAAAPVVSGVIALMLDANPLLGYRDVQEILAYSARQTSVTSGYKYNGATNWNGAGLHFSNDFGAGLVDAHAAVRLAETWNTQRTAANEYKVELAALPYAAIPDNSTLAITIANGAPVDIDHVELTLNIQHARFSDLTVTLTSPSGVSSVLASRPSYGGTALIWTYDSTQFWGETGVGNWSLSIRDNAAGATGTLLSWSLALYGDVPSANDTYIYTDEFSEMFSRDPTHAAQRATLNDTDGGIDLFNGAALTGNAVIRLGGGSSSIDGRSLTITGNVVENAYGGDGNDTIVGSTGANVLSGARGNDRLEGAAGDDTLSGGTGNDTFYGGTGGDLLYGGAGIDLASYSDAGARVVADLAPGTVTGSGELDWVSSIEALIGSALNDTLIGSVADDVMTGGAGNDLFVFRPFDSGSDTILDFGTGDHISVAAFGYGSLAEIQAAGGGMVQSGSDVILTLSTGTMPLQVRIVGVSLGSMTAARFTFATRDAFGNVIEADGSIKLVATGGNYFFESGSTLGPSLRYLGSEVVAGQFGVWTPIGAEAAGGGYDVTFRYGSADQYTTWHIDSSGNYTASSAVVSGISGSLRVLETLFNQDLDTNGVVGLSLTPVEMQGSTTLSAASGYYFLVDAGTPEAALRYAGAYYTAGQFGAWTPIAAEAAGGGYDVVWKLGADQFTSWHTDANGNYSTSLSGAVSGSDVSVRVMETLFNQDLNGDATIGLTLTAIEAQGATGLSTGEGHYFFLTGGTPKVTLKFAGTDYLTGQFGGWAPIAVEASTGGGYDVAWKMAGADEYTVWHTDSYGNYASSLTGVVSAGGYTLQALETAFNQDLNGDTTVGPVVTPIESSGATSLAGKADQYFVQTGAAAAVALRYDGAAVVAGQFGGWSPIGAEASAGGGYDVVWRMGADQYTAWHVDAGGNYVASLTGVVSAGDVSIEVFETLFAQNLDGDGMTGVALTTIETDGSTDLKSGAGRYFFETGGALVGTLKYDGADFVAGQFGDWAPIGAEAAAGGGYDIVWRNGSANEFTAWHADASGHYVSSLTGVVSGGDNAILALETLFDQNLDGDGTTGIALATIETAGATDLRSGADRYFFETGGTLATTLKYDGLDYLTGQFGGWMPIGAEAAAGGGYDVVWKNGGAEEYTAWHTDAYGNYVWSLTGVVSGDDNAILALETLLAQNLNGQGATGVVLSTLESAGSTDLKSGADRYFFETGGTLETTLKYEGEDFVAGQFDGWTPIGVEAATGGGYDVVWKNGSANEYTAWHTDAYGNYASSLLGAVSGNDPGLRALETRFDQDLNSSGYVG